MPVKFICDYCGKQEKTTFKHYDGFFSYNLQILEVEINGVPKAYVLHGNQDDKDNCFYKFRKANNIINVLGRFEVKKK